MSIQVIAGMAILLTCGVLIVLLISSVVIFSFVVFAVLGRNR